MKNSDLCMCLFACLHAGKSASSCKEVDASLLLSSYLFHEVRGTPRADSGFFI